MLRHLFISVLALMAVSASAADAKRIKIVHCETGKVLSVEDQSGDAGAKIMLAKDEAGEANEWLVEKDGDHVKVTNKKSGKVLDVNEDSRDDGASIIQYDVKTEGTDNQRWSWDGTGDEKRLVSKSSKMVLAPDTDGKIVQKKSEKDAKNQLWKVVELK